ncbi:MAG: RNA pseudouridine synthase [Treponema sp.]|jgi:RluA family pseudouridine synthase|nr:RNA pseudouridine synthase [Treponema sp.]
MKKKSPFTIIYRDKRIVVVNKSPGIAVTADRWDPAAERLDRIVALAEAASAETAPAEQFRLWTVHRIDRDTSGLVLFARDEETHRSLSLAFEGRQVEKRYLAVVYGRPLWKETSCDLPLVPNGNKKHLTIIDKYHGKESLTCFRFLGGVGNYSVVEAMPKTGRTHQIRVHLAALGHPVVCDSLYGSDKPVFLSSFKPDRRGDPLEEQPLLNRLGLHAAELALPYRPEPGENEHGLFRLRAPLSRDMAALINQMEKRGAGKNLTAQEPAAPALP